jgi:hypothetical protein
MCNDAWTCEEVASYWMPGGLYIYFESAMIFLCVCFSFGYACMVIHSIIYYSIAGTTYYLFSKCLKLFLLYFGLVSFLSGMI